MSENITRRKFLQTTGSVLALIPLVAITRQASASTNAALRGQLKYQDTPKDGMSCSTCLEFIPGKTAKDLGGCKVIQGDDEISPNGYCTKWNSL